MEEFNVEVDINSAWLTIRDNITFSESFQSH
jgi:hypothetical protein